MVTGVSGKTSKKSIANLSGAEHAAALERIEDVGAQIAGLEPMGEIAQSIEDELDAALDEDDDDA